MHIVQGLVSQLPRPSKRLQHIPRTPMHCAHQLQHLATKVSELKEAGWWKLTACCVIKCYWGCSAFLDS